MNVLAVFFQLLNSFFKDPLPEEFLALFINWVNNSSPTVSKLSLQKIASMAPVINQVCVCAIGACQHHPSHNLRWEIAQGPHWCFTNKGTGLSGKDVLHQFSGFITLFIFFPEHHSLYPEFISIALHEYPSYSLNHTHTRSFPLQHTHICMHISDYLGALTHVFSSTYNIFLLHSHSHNFFSFFNDQLKSNFPDIWSGSLIPLRATSTMSTRLYNVL